MAKNAKKRGKSVRHGNMPSPYTKYNKTPYIYSQAYKDWRRGKIQGKSTPKVDSWKTESRDRLREFKQAAE